MSFNFINKDKVIGSGVSGLVFETDDNYEEYLKLFHHSREDYQKYVVKVYKPNVLEDYNEIIKQLIVYQRIKDNAHISAHILPLVHWAAQLTRVGRKKKAGKPRKLHYTLLDSDNIYRESDSMEEVEEEEEEGKKKKKAFKFEMAMLTSDFAEDFEYQNFTHEKLDGPDDDPLSHLRNRILSDGECYLSGLFMTFPRLDGTIKDYVGKNHKTIPVLVMIDIIIQMISFLESLKQIGIYHGDIHCGNILYKKNENLEGYVTLYLIDFDRAMPMEDVSTMLHGRFVSNNDPEFTRASIFHVLLLYIGIKQKVIGEYEIMNMKQLDGTEYVDKIRDRMFRDDGKEDEFNNRLALAFIEAMDACEFAKVTEVLEKRRKMIRY